ncbi:MAG: CHAP domain-containing protein [Candidatus Saccharibacteria bacterium]|nr:CHAP domain-containing protein [Candidatus Saccharibacteria bacterium]
MKQRSTTPVSASFVARAGVVAMAVLVAGTGLVHLGNSVFARDFDAEIRAKQQEAERLTAESARLGTMADTLQGELDKLNGQIAAMQAQIAASQQKRDSLTAEIAKNEKILERNRETLGYILSDMYVDDQITPLEMLASSQNIGDFIDKQEQRSGLRASLNEKIKDIKMLQQKLGEDRKAVEAVIKDQEAQRGQLAAKQAEQAKLVADTRNDQGVYAQLAATRNAEANKLREQQRAAIAAALAAERRRNGGGGAAVPPPSAGGGGYPAVWQNAPLDAFVDPWGLYTRECVSYTAWKVHSTGRYVPHFAGQGHAYQWPATTARHGIPNGKTPKAGSVAVWNVGYYGHVMYVEAVHGDGSITVSDYNLGWDGLYRYYTLDAGKVAARNMTYIYF